MKRQKPNEKEEKTLRLQGYRLVAGVDEVGRGALMGPVMAAAVIMPEAVRAPWKSRVRDSKQLSPAERESLYGFILEACVAVGIGGAANEVIDEVGIGRATKIAMLQAVARLEPQPHYLLIDFLKLDTGIPQKGIVKGDSLVFSIACASIIAKVTRDRLIREMDEQYPGYGFAEHKGYSTAAHLDCLRSRGPCPLHRRSFAPVSLALGGLL